MKYFIDAVLSWFEIKFIHFWGGGITVLETKVAKLAGKKMRFKAKNGTIRK